MHNNLESIAMLVDHIEDHLTDKLDLDSLARRAGYSKYHLHRMFTGIVGVPVHFYVQRRRLTEAARLLVFSDQPVMDIALSAGYETQQSFTKAFRELFRSSPSAFRRKRDFYPLQLKFAVDGKNNLRGDQIMEHHVVEAEKLLLVGYKANTAKGFSVIGKCWAKMNRNKAHLANRINPDTVVALNDYSGNFDCKEDGPPAFDYYAAVEVSSFDDVPQGMAMRELPAGKYMVFCYKGRPEDSMQPVVEYVYREWFPQSTAQLNERAMYDFARLGEALDSEGKGDVKFWVPIL